jgi:hypothetical protein
LRDSAHRELDKGIAAPPPALLEPNCRDHCSRSTPDGRRGGREEEMGRAEGKVLQRWSEFSTDGVTEREREREREREGGGSTTVNRKLEYGIVRTHQ